MVTFRGLCVPSKIPVETMPRSISLGPFKDLALI
jgi:hypothetical protein